MSTRKLRRQRDKILHTIDEDRNAIKAIEYPISLKQKEVDEIEELVNLKTVRKRK